jgi:hypothetical protein
VFYKSGPHTISAIFNYVSAFEVIVPDSLRSQVIDLAKDFRAGAEGLNHDCSGPKDNTYADVARCLLRLYDAKVDHNRRNSLHMGNATGLLPK